MFPRLLLRFPSLAISRKGKALLPVANRPVLSYVLEQLELSNLKDLIAVVEGQDTALLVGAWISGAYVDRLQVEDLKAGVGEPEEVAIKIIRNNETMQRAGQSEVKILNKLADLDQENKRHCVRFLSSFKYRNHLCLVFESLYMNLREVNEAKNVLKLCDFGNAMFSGKNEITPYLVSRFYRAPFLACLMIIQWICGLLDAACMSFILGAFVDQHFDQDLHFHATEEDPVTKRTVKRMILNIKPKDIGSIVTSSPGDDLKMLANFRDL
ncbi:hypothetical protein GH714_025599 [Hevea brasiliensis]|uniref:Protein kinase domain-containing protein n=1 Tax=Hevea brasiliensis TaxID=3981 RepID=A0A6A6KWZ6_HEVBR|nr:hypothetical protein GH714_025599 [Hevea brasiliensis]